VRVSVRSQRALLVTAIHVGIGKGLWVKLVMMCSPLTNMRFCCRRRRASLSASSASTSTAPMPAQRAKQPSSPPRLVFRFVFVCVCVCVSVCVCVRKQVLISYSHFLPAHIRHRFRRTCSSTRRRPATSAASAAKPLPTAARTWSTIRLPASNAQSR
jgi:hypothetical protein